MTFWVRSRLWLGLGFLGACTGGQSGTEWEVPLTPEAGAPDAPPSIAFVATTCACDLADQAALLRAEILELEECRVRATVLEVLVPAPAGEPVEAGSEVLAGRINTGGCGVGVEASAGEEVLLVFAPRMQDEDTGGLEPPRALVARGENELVLGVQDGAPLRLPRADIDALIDRARCEAAFPMPEEVVVPTDSCSEP